MLFKKNILKLSFCINLNFFLKNGIVNRALIIKKQESNFSRPNFKSLGTPLGTILDIKNLSRQ